MKIIGNGVIALIVFCTLTASFSIYNRFFEYGGVKERTLTSFADGKIIDEHQQLNGVVAADGDTVSYNLIPAVGFAIGSQEKDVITIKKRNGSRVTFSRNMFNDWNIPNPIGEGKAMTEWKSDASDIRQEKEFLGTFKKILAIQNRVDLSSIVKIQSPD